MSWAATRLAWSKHETIILRPLGQHQEWLTQFVY